jgi:hypothetical protein
MVQQRSHHAPVNATPFVVSAGGGIMEVTDALLLGRVGRHYERQHLSGILLKYRHGGPPSRQTRRQRGLDAVAGRFTITYTFSLEKHHMSLSGVERSNNCGQACMQAGRQAHTTNDMCASQTCMG